MSKSDETKEGLFIFILTVLVFSGLILWSKLVPLCIYNEFEYYDYVNDDDCSSSDLYLSDDCYDFDYLSVTATKYNPVVSQCDLDPLITADGSFIDTLKLRNGKLKWIAISRDLRATFNYGDTVIIESESGEIDGEYVVHDTMHPRWKSKIDILSPIGDSRGKWDDVIIYKKI